MKQKDLLRQIIKREIDLLFEAFEMDNDRKSYAPTDNVIKTANNALNSIDVAKQNGIQLTSIDGNKDEGSGRQKAKKLSNKEVQSFTEMKRLKSFFESNNKNVEDERRRLGITQLQRGTVDEMSKSNILLVWNLHGGDACKSWVNSQLSNTHTQGVKTKERLRKLGGAYKNNGMGVFRTQYDPSQQRILK